MGFDTGGTPFLDQRDQVTTHRVTPYHRPCGSRESFINTLLTTIGDEKRLEVTGIVTLFHQPEGLPGRFRKYDTGSPRGIES